MKKVWWKCPDCGYEWEDTINNRTKRQSPCARCTALSPLNKKLFKGINDLATLYPELLLEWDWNKNIDIRPEEVTRSSHKKVWWKCKECGYEWQSSVSNRTFGFGCPICGRKKALETRRNNKSKL